MAVVSGTTREAIDSSQSRRPVVVRRGTIELGETESGVVGAVA